MLVCVFVWICLDASTFSQVFATIPIQFDIFSISLRHSTPFLPLFLFFLGLIKSNALALNRFHLIASSLSFRLLAQTVYCLWLCWCDASFVMRLLFCYFCIYLILSSLLLATFFLINPLIPMVGSTTRIVQTEKNANIYKNYCWCYTLSPWYITVCAFFIFQSFDSALWVDTADFLFVFLTHFFCCTTPNQPQT